MASVDIEFEKPETSGFSKLRLAMETWIFQAGSPDLKCEIESACMGCSFLLLR